MTRTAALYVLLMTGVCTAAWSEAHPEQAPPRAIQPKDANYRLGPGDGFSVQVAGDEELSHELLVAPDGYVYYPFVGRLKVSGLTLEELDALLVQKLGEQLRRPRIAVTLTTVGEGPQAGSIYVFGRVASPGAYPVRRDMKLLDALSQAGGIPEAARPSVARVLRAGKAVTEADLNKLLVEGDLSQNVALQEDDVVVVPATEVQEIMVVGRVKSPGVFNWSPGVRVLEALSQAGGVVEGANAEHTLILREGKSLACDLRRLLEDGATDQNLELKPGDVVVVNGKDAREPEVAVVGQVEKPGVYPIREGIRLLEALTLAGGPRESADVRAITITRGEKKLTCDLQALLDEGKTEQNLGVEAGDIILVPKLDRRVLVVGEVQAPGLYDLPSEPTLLNALAMAGGIRVGGDLQQIRVIRLDEVVTADVRSLLKKGDMSQNIPLKAGDTVLVAALETIQVAGQVRSPGVYPLKENDRLSDVLTSAGWPTEQAGLNNVAVLRTVEGKPVMLHIDAEGLLQKGDMSQNAVMKPGDIVVVPDKKVKKKLGFWDVLGYVNSLSSMVYWLDRTKR